MTIQTILALTDFSSPAENSLERAAQMACSHQAGLVLMYSAEEPHAKLVDPLTRLAQRARQLARRYNIQAEALTRSGETFTSVAAQAAYADLVVLDHRQRPAWFRFWRNTVLDHLLQHCRCPMLVVKAAPVRPYAQMLVSVDFSLVSQELVRYADRFEAGAELELFHAVVDHTTARMRLADVSREAIAAYQQTLHLQARQRMLTLSDSFDTRRNRVMTVVGRGDPARQTAIQQEAIGADLIVVGKRPHTPWLDRLFDSTAHRLLSQAGSDLLIVPHGHHTPSRTAARSRVAPQLPQHGAKWQGMVKRHAPPGTGYGMEPAQTPR